MDNKSSSTILRWVRLTFLYFLIVALTGLFLRFLFFQPIRGVWFNYFLHGHSHFAMLGWIFNLLFIGLVVVFIPEKLKSYRTLFWVAQIGALGMLFSFPIEGYAAMSIGFTTLHVIVSWWFAIKLLRDIRGNKTLASDFLRWGLVFMIISNFGPFGLGAAMAQNGSGSDIADLSLYYYLHFQYNGWFTFAVFALFFKLLQNHGIDYNSEFKTYFLPLMAISCILSFTLSMLWLQPGWRIYLTGFLSVIFQGIALWMAWRFLLRQKVQIKYIMSETVYPILVLSFLAFTFKIVAQFLSAFPFIADLLFQYRDLIIGYLHLVFIGFISFFLVALLLQQNILKMIGKGAKWGLWLFLLGFIGSEFLIFGKSVILMMGLDLLPFGLKLLFGISILMPLGIIVFSCYSNICRSSKEIVNAEN